jgi:hypothetical protein
MDVTASKEKSFGIQKWYPKRETAAVKPHFSKEDFQRTG